MTIIEILGPNKQPLTRADGIGFGLFDAAFENDAPSIWNSDREEDNFVGHDSRRFYIRLTNPIASSIVKLKNGTRSVEAAWFTTYANGKILDDNQGSPQVTLLEHGHNTGVFVSKGLMLVTTTIDRALPTCGGIPSLYSACPTRPIENHTSLKVVGSKDHRTRLGSMFGQVVATYSTWSAQTPFFTQCHVFPPAERRRVPMQIFILMRADNTPVVNPQIWLNTQLKVARAIYERLGVFLQTVEHPFAEKIIISGSHLKVRKAFGGLDGKDFVYLYRADGVHLTGATNNDAIELCKMFQRSNDTIRVFIFESLEKNDNGRAFPDSDWGDPSRGSIFIKTATNMDLPILADEIGHLLTNKPERFGRAAYFTHDGTRRIPGFCNSGGGHFTRPGIFNGVRLANRFVNKNNSFGGSGNRLWDVSVMEQSEECIGNLPNTSPKAMSRTFNQFIDIREHNAFVRRGA